MKQFIKVYLDAKLGFHSIEKLKFENKIKWYTDFNEFINKYKYHGGILTHQYFPQNLWKIL